MIMKIYTNKNSNLLFRQKNTNLYVENGILQKMEFLSNIAFMLNILLTKYKYNIATFNLNGI